MTDRQIDDTIPAQDTQNAGRTNNHEGMTTMSTATTSAVVIDADGHFGASARVWFAGSIESAKRYAKRSKNVQVIAHCHAAKGETITQAALHTMTLAGIWKRA